MSNLKKNNAVEDAVFWTVFDGMNNAVSGIMFWAVRRTVDWATVGAVDRAVHDAGREDPNHPALEGFLRPF